MNNINHEEVLKQIAALDQQYIIVWSKMQDHARGSKKHRALALEFSRISAELIALKKSIA